MLLPLAKALASLPIPASPVLWARDHVQKETAKHLEIASQTERESALLAQKTRWTTRDARFWANADAWSPTMGAIGAVGTSSILSTSFFNGTMTFGEATLAAAYFVFGGMTLGAVTKYYQQLSLQKAFQEMTRLGPFGFAIKADTSETLAESLHETLELIGYLTQKISFPTKRVALALGAGIAFYNELPPLGLAVKAVFDDDTKAAMQARTDIIKGADVCLVTSDGTDTAILGCSGDGFVTTFSDRELVRDTLLSNFDSSANLYVASRYLMLANDPETVEPLLKVATSSDAEMSQAALTTLVGMGSLEAVSELTHFLEQHEYGNDTDLQLRVVTALVAFGTEESMGAALENLIESGIVVPLIVPDAAVTTPEVVYY